MSDMPEHMGRSLGGAVLAALVAWGAVSGRASAADDDYLDRFVGAWSGGGTAQRTFDSDPRDVECTATGTRSGDTITVSGTCRALLVFSRKVEVTIAYDAASDRYGGTYVGSRIGPARLSGEREGDALDLTLTWPRVVNGDRTAQMMIKNAGDGRLSIVVTDRPGGTGRPVQTTNLAFTKR
jgi:hypothetical protein